MQAYIYHYLSSLTILVSTNPKYSLLPSPLSKSPSSTASCCVIKTSSKQWPNMMFFFFLLPQFQVLNFILRKASIYLLYQQHTYTHKKKHSNSTRNTQILFRIGSSCIAFPTLRYRQLVDSITLPFIAPSRSITQPIKSTFDSIRILLL